MFTHCEIIWDQWYRTQADIQRMSKEVDRLSQSPDDEYALGLQRLIKVKALILDELNELNSLYESSFIIDPESGTKIFKDDYDAITGMKQKGIRVDPWLFSGLIHNSKNGRVEALNVEISQHTSIQELRQLTRIEVLALKGIHHNFDFTSLRPLASLKDLSLIRNFQELETYNIDLDRLPQFSGLGKIKIFGLNPINVKALCQLPNLESIELCDIDLGNGIQRLADLSPIGQIKSLASITFKDIDIPDLAEALRWLKDNRQLRAAIFEDTSLTDISMLSDHPELTAIRIDRTPITSLANLTKVPKLHHIEIVSTSVESIAPLATMLELEDVHMSHSPIKDIRPLLQLPKLKKVYMYGCPAQKDLQTIEALRQRGVDVSV